MNMDGASGWHSNRVLMREGSIEETSRIRFYFTELWENSIQKPWQHTQQATFYISYIQLNFTVTLFFSLCSWSFIDGEKIKPLFSHSNSNIEMRSSRPCEKSENGL